ncbi:MAG: hypothetical protein Q8P59_04965 [Dehalococcoidia bacterium]|nr:hypothetical protein [Dehalococcoidia bacterium]
MHRKLEVLLEQLLNATIVAGITAGSLLATTWSVPPKTVLVAFVLTFLIELRKLRGT